MARKRHHNISTKMLFIWLTLAGGILLLTPQNITGKFQGAFTHIFRFPLRVGRTVSLSARVDNTGAAGSSRTETQYQNHIANLAAQLQQKNRRIEQLAKIRSRLHPLEAAALVMADVISANLTGARNELVINRGADDGLEQGQFVLGENCVIGRISRLWQREAGVKLFTDSSSQLAVTIGKPGADTGAGQSLMLGKGDARALIKWAKISPAENTPVMACRQAGFLDCPMIVGRVDKCERNDQNALLWDITVRPACDIAMLPSVTVIVMNPK